MQERQQSWLTCKVESPLWESWDWEFALFAPKSSQKAGHGLPLTPLHSNLGRKPKLLNRVEPTSDPHPQALTRKEPTNARDFVVALASRLTMAPCVSEGESVARGFTGPIDTSPWYRDSRLIRTGHGKSRW